MYVFFYLAILIGLHVLVFFIYVYKCEFLILFSDVFMGYTIHSLRSSSAIDVTLAYDLIYAASLDLCSTPTRKDGIPPTLLSTLAPIPIAVSIAKRVDSPVVNHAYSTPH